MIFQFKDLCLRLCAYISSARQQLSAFASIAPTFDVDEYLIDSLNDYTVSTPENLISVQNSVLLKLIAATFSAHFNLVRQYDIEIKKLVRPYSNSTLDKVLPDYGKHSQKVIEITNWIDDSINRVSRDRTFTSNFIDDSNDYFRNFSSKTQELKTIYDIVLGAQEKLKEAEQEGKKQKISLFIEKYSKAIGTIIVIIITALGVWVAYLALKNDEQKSQVQPPHTIPHIETTKKLNEKNEAGPQ